MLLVYNHKRMTFVTHILLTNLGVKALKLQGQDIVLAYVFGVLIDLDHFIKLPQYIKKNHITVVKHYNWRSSLQEPISLLWIIPLCFYLSSWVPAIFFLGHLFLDYCLSYAKKPFFPLSDYTTLGFLHRIIKNDKVTEGLFIIVLICLNLILV